MTIPSLSSFPAGGLALVVGATGGIGAASLSLIRETGAFAQVDGVGRSLDPPLDITDEATIAALAARITAQALPLRLVLDATGLLHGDGVEPEKSWRALDADVLARSFAVNAIGPALLMKHLLPLFPRVGKAVFATLSAKVGSIGDNRAGGWYGYRASKAALNQLVRTAAIELARRWPQAACVALHPGTVDTGLSQPFGKQGLEVRPPAEAAARLLAVIDGLTAEANGRFFNHDGKDLPW
ncbi:MAG: hypothetical protein RLY86_1957 [Pseudomonadota bacterium]|jgi:NAD(P)-dependent dehydrogenase (short-subunit alcohol dehydrogenase family)